MRPRDVTMMMAAALLAVQSACGPAEPTSNAKGNASPAAEVRALVPGDEVPDCAFTSHDGKPFTLASMRPRAVIMTFIFTRCPSAEFCPKLSMKFQELRKALDDSPWKDSVELVSVTLDPEHDTPPVLAAYAGHFGARPGSWTFANCLPDILTTLKERFSVRAAVSAETGTIEHNLITALISSRGRLVKIHDGNQWRTDEILAELPAATAGAPAVTGNAARSSVDPSGS